jgi:hypothetical protein
MSRFDSEIAVQRKRGRPRTKRSYTPKFKATDSDIPELRELKGGSKALWLNLHRDEVLDYLETHGDAETRRFFGLTTHNSLDDLKTRWFFESRHKSVSPIDRLRLDVEIVASDNANLRKEIRQLKEDFFKFQESVSDQLTKKFFIPLMRAAIKFELPEPEEEPQDPLNVQFILENTNTKKT